MAMCGCLGGANRIQQDFDVEKDYLGAHGYVRRLSSSRGVQLFAYFWPADADVPLRGIVQLLHGNSTYICFDFLKFQGNGLPNRYEGSWVQELNRHGFSVCGIDHEGCGRSHGTRSYVRSFDVHVDNAILFARHVRQCGDPGLPPGSPHFLMGYSLGGMVSVLSALRQPGWFAGMVLLSPMISLERRARETQHLRPLLQFISAVAPQMPVGSSSSEYPVPWIQDAWNADPLIYNGKARARNAEEYFRVTEAVMAQWGGGDGDGGGSGSGGAADAAADCAKDKGSKGGKGRWGKGGAAVAPAPPPEARGGLRLDCVSVPLLVFQGDRDTLVEPEGAEALVKRAATPDKRLRMVPGAWHVLVKEDGNEALLAEAVQWLEEQCRTSRTLGLFRGSGGGGGGGATAVVSVAAASAHDAWAAGGVGGKGAAKEAAAGEGEAEREASGGLLKAGAGADESVASRSSSGRNSSSGRGPKSALPGAVGGAADGEEASPSRKSYHTAHSGSRRSSAASSPSSREAAGIDPGSPRRAPSEGKQSHSGSRRSSESSVTGRARGQQEEEEEEDAQAGRGTAAQGEGREGGGPPRRPSSSSVSASGASGSNGSNCSHGSRSSRYAALPGGHELRDDDGGDGEEEEEHWDEDGGHSANGREYAHGSGSGGRRSHGSSHHEDEGDGGRGSYRDSHHLPNLPASVSGASRHGNRGGDFDDGERDGGSEGGDGGDGDGAGRDSDARRGLAPGTPEAQGPTVKGDDAFPVGRSGGADGGGDDGAPGRPSPLRPLAPLGTLPPLSKPGYSRYSPLPPIQLGSHAG